MEFAETIAIHEAGHTLMFDALGVSIAHVTIEFDELLKFEGHVRLGCDSYNVLDGLAGTLAGPAASFYIAHQPAFDAHAKYASDQELIRAMYQTENMTEPFDKVWLKLQFFMQSWLRDWMLRYERNIRRFTTALLEHRTLTENGLHDALVSAWDGLKPDKGVLHGELVVALQSQGLVDIPDEGPTGDAPETVPA